MKDSANLKNVTFFNKSALSTSLKMILSGAVLSTSMSASALEFELDNGVVIQLDTQLNYASQWRMEDRDDTLLDPASNGLLAFNADDGNKAFDKHDMTQNRLSFSTDLDVFYEGESLSGGVFVRARGFYDQAYSDDLDASEFCNREDCSTSKGSDGIEDYHKTRIELLDAFLYSNFSIGEQDASLRVGRQVVSWGESLAINGGISLAQGPIDATKTNIPGVELKEVFLPTGQVYFETGINESWSLGAYYQYDWENTRVDAPGSFFAIDILGEGAGDNNLLVPVPGVGMAPLNITESDDPDAGSYGVAIRYLTEQGTEFGFYALQYDDTLPTFELLDPAAGLFIRSFEDIDLYGASFGTVVGDTNVSGEISYRDGQPVQLNAAFGGFLYTGAETVQAQVSWSHIFGSIGFIDNVVWLGEVGYNEVIDLDGKVHSETFGTTIDVSMLGFDVSDIDASLDNDKSAGGYFSKINLDFYSVRPALDMTISASIKHDFDGNSAVGFTFTEDVLNVGIGADFTYSGVYQFGLKYSAFMFDPQDRVDDGKALELGHQFADRDNISAYVKYSF